jgi:hypothetical protein
MSDEIALNRAAERAARADALLRDELLTEAFQTLDRDYMTAWRLTGPRDTEARERLWQAVQIVGKVRDHLTNVVNGGKLAHRELAELAGKHGRFKE